MSAELKPCPYCGGEARLAFPDSPRTGFIYCLGDCGAEVRRRGQAEAIAAWNTRAPEPLLAEVREVLTLSFAALNASFMAGQNGVDFGEAVTTDEHIRIYTERGRALLTRLDAAREG